MEDTVSSKTLSPRGEPLARRRRAQPLCLDPDFTTKTSCGTFGAIPTAGGPALICGTLELYLHMSTIGTTQIEKQDHLRVTWMLHVQKLLLLKNDWNKISSEVKQMEKAEKKCCADLIIMALVEFLVWPLSLLFCIKQICKYSQNGEGWKVL